MERVTFLDPATGARITCLLNPEHLVQRREAGLRRPQAGSGYVTAALASDDALVSTGGGRTEYELDLLFDTEIAALRPTTGGAPIADVRALTRPVWELAENHEDAREGHGVRPVRFFWGTWNVLCVVLAVAERLERFDDAGHPHRSWLRLRLARVHDPGPPPLAPDPAHVPAPELVLAAAETMVVREHHIAPDPGEDAEGVRSGGQTWADVATLHYPGQPWLWRLVAALHDVVDSPFVPPGVPIAIPEQPGGLEP